MSDAIVFKQCSKCNAAKPTSEFYKDRSKPDGLTTICKACKNASVKAYRNTSRGRQVKQQSAARYRKSPVGKAARHRYKTGKAGKAASKRYRQSESGREAMQRGGRKYYYSEHGHAARLAYAKTQIGRQSRRRYSKSEEGMESSRQAAKRSARKHPERIRARRAVRDAVRDGIIPSPTTLTCRHCLANAEHYHHPSYDRDHWLTVVPLCHQCHVVVHYPSLEAEGLLLR